MKKEFQLSDRREFFADTGRSLALLAAVVSGRSHAAEADPPSPAPGEDLSRYSRTDPRLIAYEQVARWKSPHPEPKRLVVGPDDRLYVCCANHVVRLTREGAVDLDIALSEASRCVAVTDERTILVGVRDHIEVLDAAGRRQAVWESLGKRAWLTALAVGPRDVVAADSGNRVVARFDRSGKLIARLGQKDPDRHVPGFVVPSPHLDVLLGRDGLLRVNNLGRHRVEAYTLDGDFEGAWGKPSLAMDGFGGCCNPISLALLPDGRMVTCEKGIPRVKVYSEQGRFEAVVAGPESFPENAKACSRLNDCTRGGMDAAVDAQGRVYILDYVAADIRVMRPKSPA